MTKIYTLHPNQTTKTNVDDVEVDWTETITETKQSPEAICIRKIKARLQGIIDQRIALNNEEAELNNQKAEIASVILKYK